MKTISILALLLLMALPCFAQYGSGQGSYGTIGTTGGSGGTVTNLNGLITTGTNSAGNPVTFHTGPYTANALPFVDGSILLETMANNLGVLTNNGGGGMGFTSTIPLSWVVGAGTSNLLTSPTLSNYVTLGASNVAIAQVFPGVGFISGVKWTHDLTNLSGGFDNLMPGDSITVVTNVNGTAIFEQFEVIKTFPSQHRIKTFEWLQNTYVSSNVYWINQPALYHTTDTGTNFYGGIIGGGTFMNISGLGANEGNGAYYIGNAIDLTNNWSWLPTPQGLTLVNWNSPLISGTVLEIDNNTPGGTPLRLSGPQGFLHDEAGYICLGTTWPVTYANAGLPQDGASETNVCWMALSNSTPPHWWFGGFNADSSTRIDGAIPFPPQPILQTNYVLTTVWTNVSGFNVIAKANTRLITTGVSGAAAIDLFVDQAGGTSFSRLAGFDLTTTVSTIGATSSNDVSATLAPNATFFWTNASAGAGDSGAINTGTGQMTLLR